MSEHISAKAVGQRNTEWPIFGQEGRQGRPRKLVQEVVGIDLEKLEMTILFNGFSLNSHACLHHLDQTPSLASTSSMQHNLR